MLTLCKVWSSGGTENNHLKLQPNWILLCLSTMTVRTGIFNKVDHSLDLCVLLTQIIDCLIWFLQDNRGKSLHWVQQLAGFILFNELLQISEETATRCMQCLAWLLPPFSFLSLISSCLFRRCSWSPSAQSESGIWSSSPPLPTNKRAFCWAWISPVQKGVCDLDVAVQCHKESTDKISIHLIISVFIFFILLWQLKSSFPSFVSVASCLLCSDQCTIGLVLPVWSDTQVYLDGDGYVLVCCFRGSESWLVKAQARNVWLQHELTLTSGILARENLKE